MVSRLCLVAEAGFEPHDLRVMSPTSYQAAPLRDMNTSKNSCRSAMVPMTGLEPVRDFSQRILSPLRLPIPPHRPKDNKYSLAYLYSIASFACFVNSFCIFFEKTRKMRSASRVSSGYINLMGRALALNFVQSKRQSRKTDLIIEYAKALFLCLQ